MRFDHLMHWVPDRAAAVQAYQAAGFHAVIGGEHPGWGTHNALSHFGLPYIEIIALHDPGLAHNGPDCMRVSGRMLGRGGGAATFALAVSDLDKAIADLRGRGIVVGHPEPGQRLRPDGTTIRWRIAQVLAGPGWRPFLIEWGSSDPVRLAELQARGIDEPHPLGHVSMKELAVATADPSFDAWWCANLTGAAAKQEGSTWRVPLAGCDLLFLHTAEAGFAAQGAPIVARLTLSGVDHAPMSLDGLTVTFQTP